MPQPEPASPRTTTRTTSWPFFPIWLALLVPVLTAILLYQLESFDPAPLPNHELTQPPLEAEKKNPRMLRGAEFLGLGDLTGPEDIVYDEKSGGIYTTCADGWVKRVTAKDSVADLVVDNVAHTGGRPLGLALGLNNEIIVADAYKGLLNVSVDGVVELLTNEAEGLRFNFTDGVDIGDDGTIYFTDASSKYNYHAFMLDILEGRPYGRLLSFDPVTKTTQVLARDLYFPNGVAVSPDQDYVVFAETPMRRCRRYYIQGKKKGQLEKFIDNLPGLPDNIHYGDGHYWIALATEVTLGWDLASRYSFLRKVMAIISRYTGPPSMEKNAGVFVVDLEGKPTAHFHDPGFKFCSSAVKIGPNLYCGSFANPYIVRLNLDKHAAQARV